MFGSFFFFFFFSAFSNAISHNTHYIRGRKRWWWYWWWWCWCSVTDTRFAIYTGTKIRINYI
jgi:hypothetical protein